jgi:DNA invertase Pin-like site-specific DNA recombinase
MALVGYARVSSPDQDLTIQLDQLTTAGCTKIFHEKQSATNITQRPELEQCLSYVRDGDVLVITRIDRFARSVADFSKMVQMLHEKNVELRCLLQPFDTSSPAGRLMRDMLAAFAEFETAVRKERQREGIEKARANGVYKKGASQRAKKARVGHSLRKGMSVAQVAEKHGVSERAVRLWFTQYRTRKPMNGPIRKGINLVIEPAESDQALPPSVGEPIETEATPEIVAPKRGFFGRILPG